MPHQALSYFFSWRQRPSWAWFFVLLLALGGHAMGAPSGSAAIGTRDSYVLSGSFTFIEDASAALTLDDVHKPEVQARFKPVPQGATATNFGTTNSAIWLRVVLQTRPDTPLRWLLELAYPPLDRLDLYLSKPDGGYEHQSGGDSLPFPQRPVPHRNHVKPIGSFHRASNVGDIKGTGLGLAIVKQSVDLHGGSIQSRSQVGHGSCFTVRFG